MKNTPLVSYDPKFVAHCCDEVADFVARVANGEFTIEECSALAGIADTAKKALAKRKAVQFKEGDFVRLVGHLSPKYLVGTLGYVDEVEAKKGRVWVVLLEAPNKRAEMRVGERLGIPMICIEGVTDDDEVERLQYIANAHRFGSPFGQVDPPPRTDSYSSVDAPPPTETLEEFLNSKSR